jgi:hypothetical protein
MATEPVPTRPRVTCDRCGELFTDRPRSRVDVAGESAPARSSYWLCSRCAELVCAWIEAPRPELQAIGPGMG